MSDSEVMTVLVLFHAMGYKNLDLLPNNSLHRTHINLGKGHYHLSGMADEVKSAGRVGIDNGKVTYLDNQSGHYRPDSNRLIETANTFDQNGIMSPQGAFINDVKKQ